MLQSLLVFFLWTTFTPEKEGNIYQAPIEDSIVSYKNITYPQKLEKSILEAFSHFPELEDVKIDFQLIKNIKGAVMQAQPNILSLIVDRKNERRYRIKITETLVFDDYKMPIEQVPQEALVGWIGHELGHVMDYLNRSSLNMIGFGIGYTLSKKRYIEAELVADSYAIAYGLGPQILFHKQYILDHDKFTDTYKNKIRALYMSPETISALMGALDQGSL
ncbi:hypothetical protein [Mongoliitalea daihaiensis]|uniref:hypothetical protein n=1 Tax=Mongoliitalea daihaiensis TaxID=2782006 RepID=UPI001F430257|nr:hypothetical protein [Mongoliitalea daihaiensis]UJP64956.1 hypothetical protein IPZ59_19600 [Mongoliitalea daihaiensis]